MKSNDRNHNIFGPPSRAIHKEIHTWWWSMSILFEGEFLFSSIWLIILSCYHTNIFVFLVTSNACALLNEMIFKPKISREIMLMNGEWVLLIICGQMPNQMLNQMPTMKTMTMKKVTMKEKNDHIIASASASLTWNFVNVFFLLFFLVPFGLFLFCFWYIYFRLCLLHWEVFSLFSNYFVSQHYLNFSEICISRS